MFDAGDDDRLIQRGIDEALACQDMLARAPIRPSLLARARAHLAAAGRVGALPTRKRKPRITLATPLKVSP
jgi:hypothetical protein